MTAEASETVAVREFVTASPSRAELAGLLPEGRAMLETVCEVLARDGLDVRAVWCDGHGAPPDMGGVAYGENVTWAEELDAEAERTIVIAPETEGVLAAEVAALRNAGRQVVGWEVPAIELAGDKLKCGELGEPFVPAWGEPAAIGPGPWIVKPRDGAGTEETFYCRTAEAVRERWRPGMIVQPRIDGVSGSLTGIARGREAPVLLGRTDHSVDLGPGGQLRMRGGRASRTVSADEKRWAADVIRRLEPGFGWFGIDFVENAAGRWVVDVNPRLTGSVVAFAELYRSLARPLAFPEEDWELDPATGRSGWSFD